MSDLTPRPDLSAITDVPQLPALPPGVGAYAKALASIATAVAVAVVAVQGPVTTAVAFQLGAVALGAVLVYLVPNLPAGPGAYAKAAIAVLVAAATALPPLLAGGLSGQELAVVIVACMGALGVGVVPNRPVPALAA